MNLIGIDLSWQSAKNTSAAAVGLLEGNVLSIHDLRDDLNSVGAVVEFVGAYPEVEGLAIDAPLIIDNVTGQRSCEKELSRVYGARKASCHTSNLTLYPDAQSVELASKLAEQGYAHLGQPEISRWQLECYPHPAIIEIFGLQERHQYKKGTAVQKREGQVSLASLIKQLTDSPVLQLIIDDALSHYLAEVEIRLKRGAALKKNEDALDAIICTYIAGLYTLGTSNAVYGGVEDGYIYVPQTFCLEPGVVA